MTPASTAAFNRALYAEHLEEAGYLRVRREALRASDDGAPAVPEVEDRLLAHVDALQVGGEAALRCCHEAVPGADADACFAIALLACRAPDPRLLSALIAGAADPAAPRAVGDALKLAMPPDWSGLLLRAIGGSPDPWRRVLLDVAGHRRLDCASAALDAVAGSPREALRALGRVRAREGLAAMHAHLGHADPAVRLEAWLAALRVGDRGARDAARAAAADDLVAQLALGLCGGADAVPVLRAAAGREPASPQAVAALGLLGDGECWDALLELLERPSAAASAARALWAIAGGGPVVAVRFAEAPMPESFDDLERAAFEAEGRVPVRGDGQPYGVSAVVPSPYGAHWRAWAAERGLRPAPGQRMRWGVPFTPAAALDAMASTTLHPQLRRLAAEEFAIRFGRDDGFEPDALHADQVKRLAALRAWAVEAPNRPGGWPFAGVEAGAGA